MVWLWRTCNICPRAQLPYCTTVPLPSLVVPTITAVAGLVAVDNCLAGYNSSIFAYGQTGSGKTFTVIGDLQDAETVRPC